MNLPSINGRILKIRRASQGDVDNYVQILRAVAKEGRYIFTEKVTIERKRYVRKVFQDRSCLVIVAELDGRMIGSLGLTHLGEVEKTKHILNLGMLVVRGYRGKGVGTALMEYAMKWARRRSKLEKIILSVFSSNKPAIRLYEKFNFKVEGVRKRQFVIFGRHVDEVEMGLFLK